MKSIIFGFIAVSLLLASCQQQVPADKIINQKASLPASFCQGSMSVITSSINKRQHTMSTLYGNPISGVSAEPVRWAQLLSP